MTTSRRSLRSFLLLLGLLPMLHGCQVTLVAFDLPGTVASGALFEVTIRAGQSQGTGGDKAAALLQLSPLFTVVKAWSNAGPVTLDDPVPLGLYRVEPGYRLVSFSGTAGYGLPSTITLRVLLRAPQGGGTFPFKLALCAEEPKGYWQPQVPPGVTDFAGITGSSQVRNLLVLPGGGRNEFRPSHENLPWLEGSNWSGVAFGDVDHDGRQDLAGVARLGDGPHCYLSTPTGWTERSSNLTGSSGRSDVAFGDFNGDGRLDLADGNGRAWLGDGRGGWTEISQGLVIPKGSWEGVAVGDVNRDGFDDLVLGGHMVDYLQCFLADGKGGWKESSSGLVRTGAGSMGGHKLLLRDVTGDGNLDIVWTRFYLPDIWAGDGRGGWRQVGAGFTKSQFYGVAAGDMDGDGIEELFFASFHYASGSPIGGGVRVYRRSGGGFQEVTGTGLDTTLTANDVAPADFDGDGNLDVAATMTTGAGDNRIFLYRGDGKGRFTPWAATGLPAPGYAGRIEGLEAGDLDGDGRPDLAAACYGLGLLVLHNRGTGFRTFGVPCRGTLAAAPRIGYTGSHQLGTGTGTWTLAAAPAGADLFFLLGRSRARVGGSPLLPLDLAPLGAPGCALRAEPLLLLGSRASAGGAAQVNLAIPGLPALYRVTLYGQFLVAARGANVLGLVATAGGALKLE